MPAYVASPFYPPQLLQKGVPAYLWGSYNTLIGNTYLAVTNVALTTNVATVSVQLINGPLPTVGEYISIINSTSTTGLFNVNRAVITGVTIDNGTGIGTITFALTHANVTSGADVGSVLVEPAEVAETLAAANSVAVCVQAPEGDSQFTVPVAVTFPTIPTAATVTLQVAIRNQDSEYTNTTTVVTVAASAYTAGPVVQVTLQRGYFYRLAVTGITGSGTIIGKIG
jgi:hypothetical protein